MRRRYLNRYSMRPINVKSGLHPHSRAVLIGVSAYEYPAFPPIRAAHNSLLAMQSLLSDPTLCGWPPEIITVIANPTSGSDLAYCIADLAEATTGVLLVYYVGHGTLSARGDLCLTVTSTRSRPEITGLPWETLANILRTCPAQTRLAILDCCFAGQAIEALSGDDGDALADIAHVAGVYTLTATTRNRTAHVPPRRLQGTACTSFTGELLDLISSGIPGRPQHLTFADIYPVLRRRLQAKGLPVPNQRGTDTVLEYPFTSNRAAEVHNKEHSAAEVSHADLHATDHIQVTQILEDASRMTRLISDEVQRASALADLAQAIATSDPDRAKSLLGDAEWTAGSIAHYSASQRGCWLSRRPALTRVAQALATDNPDRAESFAMSICDDETSAFALAGVAQVLASDSARVENLAQKIIVHGQNAIAVAQVTQALAASDPDRAESLAHNLTDHEKKASAFAGVAQALATSDPDRASRLLIEAERLAQAITDNNKKSAIVLVNIARALAISDPDRARGLLIDAYRQTRSDRREASNPMLVLEIVEVLTISNPDGAWEIIRDIRNEQMRMAALTRASRALGASNPNEAIRFAHEIEDQETKATALADVAKALAASDSDRATRLLSDAARLARAITDQSSRAFVLTHIASIEIEQLVSRL